MLGLQCRLCLWGGGGWWGGVGSGVGWWFGGGRGGRGNNGLTPRTIWPALGSTPPLEPNTAAPWATLKHPAFVSMECLHWDLQVLVPDAANACRWFGACPFAGPGLQRGARPHQGCTGFGGTVQQGQKWGSLQRNPLTACRQPPGWSPGSPSWLLPGNRGGTHRLKKWTGD